jgi:ribosomal-protein-alanine N-acetyltransferase
VSGIQVRRATSRDLKGVSAIENASFGAEAWPAWLFEDYLRTHGNLFFVAILDKHVAGYCVARDHGQQAELDSIAVHPDYRGGGIAVRLLTHTESSLRRERVEEWFLTVRASNAEAIALYRRFGFVRTRVVPAYYEDGEDGWRMGKRVA